MPEREQLEGAGVSVEGRAADDSGGGIGSLHRGSVWRILQIARTRGGAFPVSFGDCDGQAIGVAEVAAVDHGVVSDFAAAHYSRAEFSGGTVVSIWFVWRGRDGERAHHGREILHGGG